METLKKYWLILVAIIVGYFMFCKKKVIRRKIKKYRNRKSILRKVYGKNQYSVNMKYRGRKITRSMARKRMMRRRK